MGWVVVSIKDSHVLYTHCDSTGTQSNQGHTSHNYDLFTLEAGDPATFKDYIDNSVRLSSADFVRFKNGGKRLPSSSPGKQVGKDKVAPKISHSRTRIDRSKDLVREGDIGTYKVGPNSLKQKTAVYGLERDHINSTAAVLHRTNVLNQGPYAGAGFSDGQIQARGLTIAIPHEIHKGGYTHGGKQQKKDTPTGVTRKIWVAQHPTDGFFNEISGELAEYYGAGTLTFEIVGSYRYLYKLAVKGLHIKATDDLDALIEAYLAVAT